MTVWKFCPVCGHVVEEHENEGCRHMDWRDAACLDPQSMERVPCDCKVGRGLLVARMVR